jgi:hypothetical protein
MNVSLFLEIKNEFTEYLVDIITPYISEGLNSIYREAVKIAEESKCPEKTLIIFQKILTTVANWNQSKIDEETLRIKRSSNTEEYLDNLVKSVIKSNIILLAYTNKISNLIGQTFYNNFTTNIFIHRCYTECAKDAHNNPYLFYHELSTLELKRNQSMIYKNIQACIVKAIRKVLPISIILKEFLINTIDILEEKKEINKALSEKKIERDVMHYLKTENQKPADQKLKDLMNLDKIISVIDEKKIPYPKDMQNNSIDHRYLLNSLQNPKKTDSNNKIIDIDFEKISEKERKSVSKTELSGFPIKNKKPQNLFMSELIDPETDKLIEDYGSKK